MSSTAALAQPAPDRKAIEKQAYSFVEAYAATPNPSVNQIGRWHDPVCVQVSGVTADYADAIKARIASVAKAQHLPAAAANCRTNVQINFSDDPQGTMDTIAQRSESLLGYYHHDRVKQLKTVTRPIQAWYVTATKSEGGSIDAMGRGEGASTGIAGNHTSGFSGAPMSGLQPFGGAVDDPESPAPVGCIDRFGSCYTSVLYNVLIVADSKALVGRDRNLVADDLVMLALSQPRSQDGCNVLPSVLDAFAKTACPGREPPTGLTPADSAYLSALYASAAQAKKSTEQADIAGRMAKILIANAGAGSTAAPH
jgi:hypothetical protein